MIAPLAQSWVFSSWRKENPKGNPLTAFYRRVGLHAMAYHVLLCHVIPGMWHVMSDMAGTLRPVMLYGRVL